MSRLNVTAGSAPRAAGKSKMKSAAMRKYVITYIRRAAWRERLRQGPTFAKRRSEILVRFRVVSEPSLGRVPLEFAVEAQRDDAQQHPLHERNGNIEVRTRRIAALAGTNPIAVVARRACEYGLRELVVPHLLHRNQPRLFAVRACGDHAFVADKEAAVGSGLFGIRRVFCRLKLLKLEHVADKSGKRRRTFRTVAATPWRR